MTTALEHFRDRMAEFDTANPPELNDELVRSLDLELADADGLTIADVADLLGISTDTLRYYEKAGLVTVPRTPGGHRLYDRAAIGRVVFITRLRASDMPIRDIERYVAVVDQGDSTIPQRLKLMLAHRRRIEQRIADMQWALAVVDYKINTYGGKYPCS